MSKDEAKKYAEEISSIILPDGTIIEMCFDGERYPATFFAIYRDGNIEYSDSYETGTKTLKPFGVYNDVVKNNLVRFPARAKNFGSNSELVEEIKHFVYKLLDVSPSFLDLIPYYIIFKY